MCELLHGDAHHQERYDHGDITEAVDEEAVAFADGRDHYAGDGGADEARGIHHGRIERDGVGDVGALIHHLNHEGLAGGHIESVDEARMRASAMISQTVMMGRGPEGERERLNHGEDLGDHDGAMPVPAIHPDTGEGPEHEGGDLAGEAYDAEEAADPVSR